MSKEVEYKRHRPADRSDPGFTIPGKKLRWVSATVSENNPGRIWAVIRRQDLPKDLVSHIVVHNPNAFSQGETIRRGDLVLAYASHEAASELRSEKVELAQEQEQRVKSLPNITNHRGKKTASVEVNEDRDVTQEMIEKFKEPEAS